MPRLHTPDSLRTLFQSAFDLEQWYELLQHFFKANELKNTPERILDHTPDEGYYLGCLDTSDSYRIGLFHYRIAQGSVANKRVGLRNLVKSFINPIWGEFDAALVVFDSGDHWRLSFICDIKGEATSPKRYTFGVGEHDTFYHTAGGHVLQVQETPITFSSLGEAFSVEPLTKQFYKDLFEWYLWAVDPASNITFPNNTAIEDDDREDIETKIIRMITRLMFVWFIKQKQLVPPQLFEAEAVGALLKDFDPYSPTVGNYYNAILQNLFFGTLNRAIKDDQGNTRKFATSNKRDIKNLYRYAEMFAISQAEVIALFAEVPFLNGGLFECLDKTRHADGVDQCYNYDGFSRNDLCFADGRFKHRAVVPNILFFDPEKGLLSILKRYNFTIEENSPEEQEVALDPELLGKVFENLLGAYNPETQETARNQSGSFYTPREVVNYMVDESLIAYLGDTAEVRQLFRNDFEYAPQQSDFYRQVAQRLKQVKILDPACGSGAFPMGLLSRMVEILQRICPTENTYDLKLYLIENCLYGSDIQSIAAQITKLRFFISLICECEKDASKPNFGIPTLPNLETKFVSADSLIAKKQKPSMGNLFENPEIHQIKEELIEVRHKHFSARSTSTKHRLREKDQELRERLAKLLSEDKYFSSEEALQLAAWNPYDQNAVSPFFDPEWMFGIAEGFDIVIGNPPYVQLQNNGGELAERYKACNYTTLNRRGDLYCLFYERGWQLLKERGHLCYITSNKWMRAGYGQATRNFFATQTNPKLLIDFAGVKVFESATVDTNILLFERAANQQNTTCALASKLSKESLKDLSLFVQQEQTTCAFQSADSWVILSPIEQSIKRKIEAVGKPLKEWDIQINYGIKTGCNEAFIISTEKREEILANCQSEDERQRTAELIRPILRGRDIKRYGYEWAELWLIYIPWHFPYQFDESIQGASEEAEKAFKEQYPAVYSHMLEYKEPLSKRNQAETGIRYEWYAMQRWGAKYWEDFDKPKIIFQEMVQSSQFYYDSSGTFFCNDTCRIITGSRLPFLLLILNSKLFFYSVKHFYGGGGLGETGVRMKHTFFQQFPCIPYDEKIELSIGSNDDEYIEQLICQKYHLSTQEIQCILND